MSIEDSGNGDSGTNVEPTESSVAPNVPRGPASAGIPGAPLLLDVRDIKTHFRTSRGLVRAVDGVSLTLERGKTLGVVGESGSGKSVLSRSIMGLLPRNNLVSSGEVLFEGSNISDLSEDEHRRLWGTEMAMIFQDPMTALNPVMKIGNQITESLRFHLDMGKSEAKATAVALLHAVKIPEPEKRFSSYPHEMSGGMRQRVVIAVALACGPKLLFADEPTTALDVTVQAQILDLLDQQQSERYMAMILVTHDLGVVAGRADHIAVMYAGRIVEHAPTKELFQNLKMPYTEALLSAIPRLSDPSHTRLMAIGGRPPDLTAPPVGCAFSPRCPYVQKRCREESPPLVASPDNPEHQFACFYPVGSPETEEIRVQLQARRVAGPTEDS
ncbi:MAG TPA: ABC transporter ATP-binding protein [Microthrixaceae bacterium]|nr:ABC transporter ATP-binding protein [Microthrixaceae bacterium]